MSVSETRYAFEQPGIFARGWHIILFSQELAIGDVKSLNYFNEEIVAFRGEDGKAVVGTYSAEIAETKVAQINQYARANQHPLLCTMEQRHLKISDLLTFKSLCITGSLLIILKPLVISSWIKYCRYRCNCRRRV